MCRGISNRQQWPLEGGNELGGIVRDIGRRGLQIMALSEGTEEGEE